MNLPITNQLVKVEFREHEIVVFTLNRPEKRNALSIDLMKELSLEIKALHQKRVVIIQGSGSSFCAGLDLEEVADSSLADHSSHALHELLKTVSLCPCVTIAAIHGTAIAGGAGLASACDLVIAAQGTQMGFPEVKRGLIAALVMTFLRRNVSEHVAKELLLLGELIDTERALSLGLINKIVRHEILLPEALHMAQLALKSSPEAITMTKTLWNQLSSLSIEEQLLIAHAAHKSMRSSPEAVEGIQAFFEHRKPNWEP